MMKSPNVDATEIGHFNQMAKLWWDPNGKMGQLHAINDLRLQFITERDTVAGRRIADVGCGGGILAEALAKAGARVTGIDLAKVPLDIAREHAADNDLAIDYRYLAVEALASTEAGTFDTVTCMEVLEHVPHPERTITACAALLKPGGMAFFSTINRTLKAFMFAIVAGEYILRLLPRGTHHYRKLVKPMEMRAWASIAGFECKAIASLVYNPFTRKFRAVSDREDINYVACFIRKG